MENLKAFLIGFIPTLSIAIIIYTYNSIADQFLTGSRSKALLASIIFGLLYSGYLILYFTGIVSANTGLEQLAAFIATFLIIPHAVVLVLAVIFNIVAFCLNSKPFAITTGVMYSVSGVVFLPYLIFVIPMIILSFVGVASVVKIAKSSAIVQDELSF